MSEQSQLQRVVMNGCPGVTNFVEKDKLYESIETTVDSFINQLKPICGPYSRYNLILIPNNEYQTVAGSEYDQRIFTKDGRKVIEYSEYVSPIENYLKSMILYIGTQIDNVCHDGTTTSMLFACNMIKSYIANKKEISETSSSLDYKTTVEIERTYKKIFEEIKERMKKELFTLESIESLGYSKKESASIMAYLQSLTSSNGDKEIALEISKFFKNMPECSWNDAIARRLPACENKDKRIEAVLNENEIEFNTQCMSFLKNNYDNGNSYRNEDIDLLIIPQGLPDYDISTQYLYNFIDNELTDPLVIFVPNIGMGNSVISTIQEKALKQKKEIIVLSYGVPTKLSTNIIWHIDSICAKANKPKFMQQDGLEIKDCIIHHACITISKNNTKLDKLTPIDEREHPENTHPGLTYPDDYIHYTRFKNTLDKELELYQAFHKKDTAVINLIKQANTLIHVVHPTVLKLGGMTHEVQAIIPVIEDCAGASMASVSNGVYFNGVFRLYNVILEIIKEKYISIDYLYSEDSTYSYEAFVYYILYEAAKFTSRNIYGPLNNADSIPDLPIFKSSSEFYDITTRNDIILDVKPIIKKLVDSNFTLDTEIPPLQSANFITELLDRTRELIVKLSMTESLIVPGSAWLETNKK